MHLAVLLFQLQSMIERSETARRAGNATSVSLLIRLRAQDRAAWHEFVALYAPLVVRWCHRRGLAEPDIADVTQEVFFRVAGNIGQFRKEGPEDSLRGWLCRITHREIAQFYRKRDLIAAGSGGTDALMHLQAQPDQTNRETDEEDIRQETRYLYQRAVEIARSEFTQTTWLMFFRTAVDGNPAVRVAEELGATAAAVRQARSRVLRRLKQVVGDEL